MTVDEFSPITVLVGRNNTGKSAFLEAVALASTAEAGWIDAFETDVLETIIKRRGGWSYSSMMIKLNRPKATIRLSGNNVRGNLEILRDIEGLPEDLLNKIAEYLNDRADSIIQLTVNRLTRRYPEEESGRMVARIKTHEDNIRSAFLRLLRENEAFIFYKDEIHQTIDYALILGNKVERVIWEELERIIPSRYLILPHIDEIIRSTPRAQSKTILMLTASVEYLKKLQRNLLRTGELLNLIDFMRKKISYFRDLREIEDKFVVFLEGFKEPIPLDAMGDGFCAQLIILSTILMAKDGIILMEEPEIRLHPGFMSAVAEQIAKAAARKEGQFIISTHSLDFLRFLLETDAKLIKVIRMFLIEKTGEIDYEILSGEEALERMRDLEEDLRCP